MLFYSRLLIALPANTRTHSYTHTNHTAVSAIPRVVHYRMKFSLSSAQLLSRNSIFNRTSGYIVDYIGEIHRVR